MKNSATDTKPKILIVDDDQAVCSSIHLLLKKSGFTSATLNHPDTILSKIESEQPDLILLDMNFTIETSGKKGIHILKQLKLHYPNIPVILMTGWATIQLAVEGMKIGAKDFIAKPWDNKELLNSIRSILTLSSKTNAKAGQNIQFDQIIGKSKAFLEMLGTAQKVSQTNASVLICGESGTGKELVAEAIHYNSPRAAHPFIKVNLGGISSSLFESEMFGHKKGAFTDAIADRRGRFEMADRGTIFLDEIGDLALSSQVKLLRVLQEKTFEVLGSSQTTKVDIRLISATNKVLEEMVRMNEFREDLYYRINLIKLVIPPLRERRSDIPLLLDFFVNNFKKNYEKPDLKVTPAAYDWMYSQHFPGNVRQLQNLVERTVILSNNNVLEAEDFQKHYIPSKDSFNQDLLPAVGKMSLEQIEVKMIQKAMAFHQYKISAVAKSLGITRSALYRRLQKFNIPYEA